MTINNLRVPYHNPSSISGDEKVRVVFFKENLSTGWDCPQAETMMSFRRAVDATYIAQLLWRMIRTPMQRHIDTDDTLNEVRLYLPYFDENTVQEVVSSFQQGDILADIIGTQLFVDKVTGTATIKLNSWEEGVLKEERQRKDFICWLRNRQCASWALCIPYKDEQGKRKPFFSDFLIMRRDEDGYVVDILETHRPNELDNIGKAKGFAEYVKQNPISSRLQLIRQKQLLGQDVFIRPDMSKRAICDKVCKATNNSELDNIFEEYGQSDL